MGNRFTKVLIIVGVLVVLANILASYHHYQNGVKVAKDLSETIELKEIQEQQYKELVSSLGMVYISDKNSFMECIGHNYSDMCYEDTYSSCMEKAGSDLDSSLFMAYYAACSTLKEEALQVEKEREEQDRVSLFATCDIWDGETWESCLIKAFRYCMQTAGTDKRDPEYKIILKQCTDMGNNRIREREDLRLLVEDLEGGRVD